MNMNFKLGKVVVPVSDEKDIVLEGVEFGVEDYDMKEAFQIIKELPKLMAQLNGAQATQPEEEEEEHPLKELFEAINGATTANGLFHKKAQGETSTNFDELFKQSKSFPNLDDLMAQEEKHELPDALKKLLQNNGAIPIAIKVSEGVSISDILKGLKGQ